MWWRISSMNNHSDLHTNSGPRTNFGPKLKQLMLGFNRHCFWCVLVVQEWTQYTPQKISSESHLKRVEETTFSWPFQKGKGCLSLGGYVSFWGCSKTWHVFGLHHSSESSCDQTPQTEVMAYLFFCRNHIQSHAFLRNNGHFYNGNLRAPPKCQPPQLIRPC